MPAHMCRSSCGTTWTLNAEYQTESTAFVAGNVKHIMARHVLIDSRVRPLEKG